MVADYAVASEGRLGEQFGQHRRRVRDIPGRFRDVVAAEQDQIRPLAPDEVQRPIEVGERDERAHVSVGYETDLEAVKALRAVRQSKIGTLQEGAVRADVAGPVGLIEGQTAGRQHARNTAL